jgi:hypothetical protein
MTPRFETVSIDLYVLVLFSSVLKSVTSGRTRCNPNCKHDTPPATEQHC